MGRWARALLPAPAMADSRQAKRWLSLAVASLILSGLLSLLLVVGRMPGLHELFTDPLFFRRGLVVHVDLALIIWFVSFLTSLCFLVPTRRPTGRFGQAGVYVACAGVLSMVAAAGVPAAEPVLANYVPVVDTPLFTGGLAVFGVGVLMAILGKGLRPAEEVAGGFLPIPSAARVAVRAGAILLILAALTFAASALVTSTGLPAQGYYEVVAWGGGHVMQSASVAGMLAAWILLIGVAIGKAPMGRGVAVVLFGALVLPLLAAPLIALQGTTHATYRSLFTDIMRWGIFPVVLVALGFMVMALIRARSDGDREGTSLMEPHVLAFATSAALTITGFLLGAMIRGANTMVPAHYHASIGAVTVAYMAVTYPILRRFGMPLPTSLWGRRLVKWQPVVFGVGQVVFAVGFGMAGAQGMERKVYGTEQHIRTLSEWIGLGVMGVGGAAAIVGGLLFLGIVVRAFLARPSAHATEEGVITWTVESIRSRS